MAWIKELLHLYSELKNEYISLRIKAANDETLLSAKSLDALGLHHRGSRNNCLKASRNLLAEYWNIQVGEGSIGGYPPDPDAILRYPGNVLVGPSDNRVRICESESEEDVEVNEPVSARTRAGGNKDWFLDDERRAVAAAVATVTAHRRRRLKRRGRDSYISRPCNRTLLVLIII